jgi:hypothetical protein
VTVAELIAKLQTFPGDKQVMILDSFNGAGIPREINLGPVFHEVTADDIDVSGDVEDMIGATVVVMGYGCY